MRALSIVSGQLRKLQHIGLTTGHLQPMLDWTLKPLILKSQRPFNPARECSIPGTARLNDWNCSPNSQ